MEHRLQQHSSQPVLNAAMACGGVLLANNAVFVKATAAQAETLWGLKAGIVESGIDRAFEVDGGPAFGTILFRADSNPKLIF